MKKKTRFVFEILILFIIIIFYVTFHNIQYKQHMKTVFRHFFLKQNNV